MPDPNIGSSHPDTVSIWAAIWGALATGISAGLAAWARTKKKHQAVNEDDAELESDTDRRNTPYRRRAEDGRIDRIEKLLDDHVRTADVYMREHVAMLRDLEDLRAHRIQDRDEWQTRVDKMESRMDNRLDQTEERITKRLDLMEARLLNAQR